MRGKGLSRKVGRMQRGVKVKSRGLNDRPGVSGRQPEDKTPFTSSNVTSSRLPARPFFERRTPEYR